MVTFKKTVNVKGINEQDYVAETRSIEIDVAEMNGAFPPGFRDTEMEEYPRHGRNCERS